MRMMSYANNLASDSWKSISDAFFPKEQQEIDNFQIWHPSTLDKNGSDPFDVWQGETPNMSVTTDIKESITNFNTPNTIFIKILT